MDEIFSRTEYEQLLKSALQPLRSYHYFQQWEKGKHNARSHIQ